LCEGRGERFFASSYHKCVRCNGTGQV
jgi:hypothetical protein